MNNRAMHEKLKKREALDVRTILQPGEDVFEDDGATVYPLKQFVSDVDYCDAETEAWIWSIGKRKSDGRIFASTDTRFYNEHAAKGTGEYECLWLR